MQFVFHASAHAEKGANKAQDPRGVNGHNEGSTDESGRYGTILSPLAFVSQQNRLVFFGQRKFHMPHRATLIRPLNLDPQAAKFVESAVAYAASAAK